MAVDAFWVKKIKSHQKNGEVSQHGSHISNKPKDDQNSTKPFQKLYIIEIDS
jgi:hypothetical protein